MTRPGVGGVAPASLDWVVQRFRRIEGRLDGVNGSVSSAVGSITASGFVQEPDPGQKAGRVWLQPSTNLFQISDGSEWLPVVDFSVTVELYDPASTDTTSASFDAATQVLTLHLPKSKVFAGFAVVIDEPAAGDGPSGSFDVDSETLTLKLASGGGTALNYFGDIEYGTVPGNPPTFNIDNTNQTMLITLPPVLTYIAPRVKTLTKSGTTFTPVATTTDVGIIASPTAAFTIAAPSGTKVDGQTLTIRIRSGSAAFAASWNATYLATARGALPQPVASKTVVVDLIWDAASAHWVVTSTDSTGY